MNYTLIPKGCTRLGSEELISISKASIYFSKGFLRNFELKSHVLIYVSDDGFLCLKFISESDDNAYSVTQISKGQYAVRIPTTLKKHIKYGRYSAVERDGFIVTNCKIEM